MPAPTRNTKRPGLHLPVEIFYDIITSRQDFGYRMTSMEVRLQAGLLIAYLAAFVLFLDNNSLSPLISPYAQALGASVALTGIIVGAYSASNLLGNLGAGWWVDRVGRRLPLVIGLSFAGTVLLLYPFASSPSLLLGLQVLHGLGAALISPACLACIGDLVPENRRGRAMAWYGVASSLAGLMGPPLAGLLRDLGGYPPVFISLSIPMFVLTGFAAKWVHKGYPPMGLPSKGDSRSVISNRRLLLAYVSAFCWMFGFGTLVVFLPILGRAWGFSSAQVGLLFASFALAAALVQASPLGRLSDRWGRERLIGAGLLLLALALLGLSQTSRWEILMAWMFIYGIGLGLLFPAMTALLADETEVSIRGSASGIFFSMLSLGIIAGMWSAGGLEWLQQKTHIHPFQWAALLILPGVLWAWIEWLLGKRRQHAP